MKNKKTFADSARAIIRKYPRAKFDKAEKDAMEQELDALIAEQEATKQAMGLDAPMEQTQPEMNPAMMEGQMEEPQMFDGGGFWNTINKGIGYIGDAYKFIDTGGGVLPQEIYDPEIGSIPYNMGVAPIPGRGIKGSAAIPSASSWAKGKQIANLENARAAKKAKQAEDIMNKLVEAPGSLGKQYPTGVKNVENLTGKLPSAPSGIPWKNIGYGAAGVGATGASIYGLSQIPAEEGTSVNTNTIPMTTSTAPSIFPAGYPKAQPSFLRNNYAGWNGAINYPTGTQTAVEKVPEVSTTPVVAKPTGGSGGVGDKKVVSTVADPLQSTMLPEVTVNPATNKPYNFTVDPKFKLKEEVAEEIDMSQRGTHVTKSGGDYQTKFQKLMSNELLPSYISAGTNIAGNLLQMALDKKPKNVNFARYSPEDIDLSGQRMTLQTDADLSRSIGRNVARNTGMNAGQAMSNIVASESDVSRNLVSALMQSRLAEETTNVGERNKAGQINAEIGMKEAMINREMQEQHKQRQLGYMAGAMQSVPDAMKDINQIKSQMEYLKMMGVSEENALKWLNQKYPNYKGDWKDIGTIFNKQ